MGFLDRLLAPAGYTPPIDPNAPQGVGGMPSAAQALAAPPPDALPPGVGQGGIADPTSAAPAINMNSPTLKDVQIGAPPGGSPQPIAGPPPGLLESMAMRDVPGVNDAPPQGFLGRLTATDPNGVTFRDKLMALGSILKGDNEGATKYLENQQAKAMQLRQAVMARNMASIQAQAFAKSFRDDGTFDPRAYAAWTGMAFDPKQAAELQQQFGPEYTDFTTREGAVIRQNKRAPQTDIIVPNAPEKPPQFMMRNPDPNGPQFVKDQAQIDAYVAANTGKARGTAEAKKDFAVPKATTAKPKSYTPDRVQWH